VVQGSAADVLKAAMIALQARLRTSGLRTRMVLTVHDELVFDVPRDEVDAVQVLISDVMCNAVPLRAPLGVDLHVGRSWD
jgi:DNA polymerase I